MCERGLTAERASGFAVFCKIQDFNISVNLYSTIVIKVSKIGDIELQHIYFLNVKGRSILYKE